MIDTHACTIYDDRDGSNFEDDVDYSESFWISTQCDVPFAKLGHIPLFY